MSTAALKEEEDGGNNHHNNAVLGTYEDDPNNGGRCNDEVQMMNSETKIAAASMMACPPPPPPPCQQAHEEEASDEGEREEEPPIPIPETTRPDFHPGDHVYQWCSFLGIPGVFAHHGIVLDVLYDNSKNKWYLSIADFDNWQKTLKNREEEGDGDGEDDDNVTDVSANVVVDDAVATGQSLFQSSSMRSFNSSSNSHQNNGMNGGSDASVSVINITTNLRTYKADPTLWKKVEYGVEGFWKQHLSRGGTVTKAQSDPPAVVLARVEFLMNIPSDKLPFKYDWIQSNCECIAVWCKCGIFTTLQGAQFLHGLVAGQVKSTATVAGAVATTQVTVPAAGIWGTWFGYTTQVSLLSTQPWILPTLIVGSAISIGAPAIKLALTKKHWKTMTETLNNEFWNVNGNRPDLLIDCIQHYKKTNDMEGDNIDHVKDDKKEETPKQKMTN